MNAIEFENELVKITKKKIEECNKKISQIDKEQKIEHKALILQREMYNLFLRAGLLYYSENNREHSIARNSDLLHNFLKQNPSFRELSDIYENLNHEDQLKIAPFLRGTTFIQWQFLDLYENQLISANESGDIKNAFELKIKITALKEMLHIWQLWWNENGFVPCEVIK